jgi:hypothetical protein
MVDFDFARECINTLKNKGVDFGKHFLISRKIWKG